jgi:RNA polymerase sigma-70 factor (ECF subfamily)
MKPSFETLVDTHGPEIFAYLWRLLLNTDDADDCFQETFLRAYKAYSRLRPPANYRAWLYKIATNTSATFLKRRTRLAGRTADLPPDLPAGGAPFEDQLETHLSKREVRRAVERLPKKQKAALLLRNYQGLSYQEIGLALDTTPTAARANVYQAIQKLRERFAPVEKSPEIFHEK